MSAAGISIDFAPQIAAFAKAHDLDLSREGTDSLNATLQNLFQLDGAKNVSFPIGSDGKTGTLEQALTVYSEGTPRKIRASESLVSVTAGMNPTERAVATNAARRTPVSEARAAEAVKLVNQYGNPWKTNNGTHRAIVMNKNPELANQLKSEAGTR